MNKYVYMKIFDFLDDGYLILLREVNKSFKEWIDLYFENYDTDVCKLYFLEYCNINTILHLMSYYPKYIQSIIQILIKYCNNINIVLYVLEHIKIYCGFDFKGIQIDSINNIFDNTSFDKIFKYPLDFNLTNIYTVSLSKYNNISRCKHLNDKYKYSTLDLYYCKKYRNNRDINTIKYIIQLDESMVFKYISDIFKFDTLESLNFIEKHFKHDFILSNNMLLDIISSDNIVLFQWLVDNNYINGIKNLITSLMMRYCSTNLLKYSFEINYINIYDLNRSINDKSIKFNNTNNITILFDFLLEKNITIPDHIYKNILYDINNYIIIETLIHNYNYEFNNIKYLMDNPIIGIIYNLYLINDSDVLNNIDDYIKLDNIDGLCNYVKYNKYFNKIKIYIYWTYVKLVETNNEYSTLQCDKENKEFVEHIKNNLPIRDVILIYNKNHIYNFYNNILLIDRVKITVLKWYIKQIGYDNLHKINFNEHRIINEYLSKRPFIFKYLVKNKIFNIGNGEIN